LPCSGVNAVVTVTTQNRKMDNNKDKKRKGKTLGAGYVLNLMQTDAFTL